MNVLKKESEDGKIKQITHIVIAKNQRRGEKKTSLKTLLKSCTFWTFSVLSHFGVVICHKVYTINAGHTIVYYYTQTI